jgi:DNA-binding Xre family transcriptional regulator
MIICRLAEILKQKDWSMYRLRQKSGVSYPTLLALFHNRSTMFRADVLDKLCRALHCGPGDLLVRSNSPRRPKATDPK